MAVQIATEKSQGDTTVTVLPFDLDEVNARLVPDSPDRRRHRRPAATSPAMRMRTSIRLPNMLLHSRSEMRLILGPIRE
jgi:hypothetical protein